MDASGSPARQRNGRQPMQAEAAKTRGVLVMIHPKTGDMFVAGPGEGALARALILEGYNPIGPRGQAAAAKIRAA